MFFLIHYARVVQAVRRFLSRKGVLAKLDAWARRSRTGLWFRSLFSVLDFHDFITLETPWWTLESGREIKSFLESTPHARVLEWGSGASTVWLGALSGYVASVESDANWASMVKGSVGENVEIFTPDIPRRTSANVIRSKRWGFRHLDFTHYVHAIDDIPGQFNLIVIDGRAREACFHHALNRLTPGGVILFDNTNRLRYRRAIKAWKTAVTVSRSVGLTPIVPWPTETSIIRLEPDYAAAETAEARATARR